jgi:hypothetical protein
MRTRRHALWVAAAIAAALAGCRAPDAAPAAAVPAEVRVEVPGGDTTVVPRAELDRARRTADALGQELAGLVLSTMQEEGTVSALRVCSEVAQERTEAHAREGVEVRRVSDRLRNPANAPDAAEARELARFAERIAAGESPAEAIRLVRQDDAGYLHYLRPIRAQPGCLACHGEPSAIDPGVMQLLRERYPEDRAVGYTAGDLRGAISVRVPLHRQD